MFGFLSDKPMRIVSEIPHPECKITLFNWNNRYLLKLEKGYLEQTYKIDQFEVPSDGDILKLLDSEFMTRVLMCFDEMEGIRIKLIQQH